MTSNLELLSVALGIVLSALTALTTHAKAPPQLKAVVLLLFSAVASVVLPALTSTFEWRHVLMTLALTFFTAVGSHFGLLKPVGVTGSDGVLSQIGLKLGTPTSDGATDVTTMAGKDGGSGVAPAEDTGAPDPAP